MSGLAQIRGWRGLLNLGVFAATVGLIATGVFVLMARATIPPYPGPMCAAPAQALSQDCFVYDNVTVVSIHLVHNGKLGPIIPTVVLDVPGTDPSRITVEVPQPPSSFYSMHPGQQVQIRIWHAVPTLIDPLNGSKMRTQYNPLSLADLELWSGIAILGVAGILLAIHPPLWLLPVRLRNRAEHLPERWEKPLGKADNVFRYRPLRMAILALILLNLLDILTSIIGGKVGLYESNPVAAEMVRVWGPLGGFFVLKLPSLIVIILAASKLPRKMAVVVAYAGCAVMMFVVIGNITLEVPTIGAHVISGAAAPASP